jgi:hypothetical protein
VLTWILIACTMSGLTMPVKQATPSANATPLPPGAKAVFFAILEDYDKGQDLDGIALDFQLMNELEIRVMRCSFGWDDYEPVREQYDFAWLQEFVKLASDYGISLRPYLAYTAPWAGMGSDDDIYWNNPPDDYQEWYNFVYQLALALRDYPNVLSYEIYNEENDELWWDGTVEQYKETLKQAALAVEAADPDAQIILGGLTYADVDWLRALTESGYARYYDATPLHAYPETWTEPGAVVENYLTGPQYQERFLSVNNDLGEAEPIWINEMGFATTPGKSEEEQANWFARAVSTFLADPAVEHIGFYEIKDLPHGSAAIGDDANYYLGITRSNRAKKLAFYTVDLLTDLLDTGSLTVADAEITIHVASGQAGDLYHHLFRRPDGRQVLFVYDKAADPTVNLTLHTRGKRAVKYELDGSSASYAEFDGVTLSNVHLSAGQVAIFEITP